MAEEVGKEKQYFSPEEIDVLSSMYTENSGLLQGTFQGASGSKLKKRKWEELRVAVNAVSGNSWTQEQLKKKIANLRRETKSKASGNKKKINKTGGGQVEIFELTQNEEQLLSTFSAHQLTGIPGGIDVNTYEFESGVFSANSLYSENRIIEGKALTSWH
jgi:Myb/SANT-like DNA-binding protein